MKCIVARQLVIGIKALTFHALKGCDEAYQCMFIVIEVLLFINTKSRFLMFYNSRLLNSLNSIKTLLF